MLTPEKLQDISVKWVEKNLAFGPQDSVVVKDCMFDESTSMNHCYLMKQSYGLDIVNSMAQLTLSASGNVLAHGNCWIKPESNSPIVKRDNSITCQQAIESAAKSLNITKTNAESWKVFTNDKSVTVLDIDFVVGNATCHEALYKTESSLKHIWSVVFNTDAQYLNLMVDISNGNILGAADWNSHFDYTSEGRLKIRAPTGNFEYRALPLGALNPRNKPPVIITNPADTTVSLQGWHDPGAAILTTSGNNVIVSDNRAGLADVKKASAAGKQAKGAGSVFDFAMDDTTQEPSEYISASMTNVFFLANAFHDIFYHYGFTEATGNFQKNNFNKGGAGGDPVLAFVQDGSGKNNANFATPPDGQSGILRLFVFTNTNPNRDGAMENSIVLHELTHGVSSRLTGGKRQGNCLSTLISGGLGEGWSDAIAIALELGHSATRGDNVALGEYVTGNSQRGIRSFPYSTNLGDNPLKYSNLNSRKEVHAIGEVWAVMLYELYWNLVDQFGFDDDFVRTSTGNGGNTRFLKLLITGMKLQPCFPNFVNARDAILAADKQLYKSENACLIWAAFSKRGLGAQALGNSFVDDSTVPANCEQELRLDNDSSKACTTCLAFSRALLLF
ncbi:Fungalysin/Thermolysin Extracellular metalloproteinase 5 [Boothiomyces macroporosus]|uniref:Extracellular metalloproteinase n=1 Tax=Boothiomyces macroporosus TaxID=261099 RepID=A0AAD5UFM2_9FUNG|nr:Fungalysin/Thermolysin Extracellular metalloproteinase 5 [Boothiomyces macroporosus]